MKLTFSRGFVVGVSGTLADLTDNLALLLRREPLTAAGIEVSDKEPCRHRIRVKGEWIERWAFWAERVPGHEDLPHITEAARVPHQLLDHMDSGYPTPDAARLALGEAIYRLHSPKSEVTT